MFDELDDTAEFMKYMVDHIPQPILFKLYSEWKSSKRDPISSTDIILLRKNLDGYKIKRNP